MTEQSFYRQNEQLITAHYGEEYEHYYNAIVPPVFMNSLNVFETLDDYYDFDRRDPHKYCYGRVQNPTVRILEEKIAALENGTGALAFASGMAAATTAVMTVCKTGSHVVCIRNAYGPLKDFLAGYCKEHMNVDTTFVKGDQVSDFEESVTDRTDLIVLESPSSLVFSLQDIRAVSEIAHAHGARVYIDNTFCTPFYQKPLDLGADIVMHTTSKYIGGHSDLIGGMLAVKDEELMKALTANRELFGGIPGPMEAWLMIRGLRTMGVRIAQHQETALKVAQFLENHPKVRKVNYPGLPSHPQYELMKRQQTGNTGLMSFEIEGPTEQAVKVAESLKIFKIGVSWGGFESLVFMPHLRLDEATCETLGGSQNIIRIHCGLEGSDALIADLEAALAQI
jgi:cystathionine gamma-lyase